MTEQAYFAQFVGDFASEYADSYTAARGIFHWQPGDEPAEVSIRRWRDGCANTPVEDTTP